VPAGAAFHADCIRILQETEAAVARVGSGGETPAGTLRITASIDFGGTVIAPLLTGFMAQNPNLMIDFVATDQIVDLVGALRSRHPYRLAARFAPARFACAASGKSRSAHLPIWSDTASHGTRRTCPPTAESASRSCRLVPLLPSWGLPEGGVHTVYPATRYPPAKVRLFIDFLRARLARPDEHRHRSRGGRDAG